MAYESVAAKLAGCTVAPKQDAAAFQTSVEALLCRLGHSRPVAPSATPTTTSGSLTPQSLSHSPPCWRSAPGEDSPRKILLDGPPGLSPEWSGGQPFPAPPSPPRGPHYRLQFHAETQKEEIVEVATTLIKEHLDQSAEAMVSAAWKRGQLFFDEMQEQQVAQAATVQKQLVACAATQRRLQQENAALKQAVEGLVQRLEDIFDRRDVEHSETQVRPCISSLAARPSTAARQDVPRECVAAPMVLVKSLCAILASRPGQCCLLSDVGALMPGELRQRLKEQGGLRKFLNKHNAVFTVTGSPGKESVALNPQKNFTEDLRPPNPMGKEVLPTVQELSGEGSADSDGASASSSSQAEVETFSITLRCADGVGLGLEVSAARSGDHLTVVAALPGGAMEAWNKACAGGTRQICAQDRIIDINGTRISEEMLAQVRDKLLLKMQVQRGAVIPHNAPAEVLRLVI